MSTTSPISVDTDYFRAIPWCDALISATGQVVFIPTSRLPDDDRIGATRDQLFRKSLYHSDGLPHCIGLYQDPEKTPDRATPTSEPGNNQTLYISSSSLLCDVQPGLNGFNGSVHGGIITSLIDEAMGNLMVINHLVQTTREKQGKALPGGVLDLNSTRAFTASMNVRFQKPVPTPSVVIVTASLVKIDGRKLFFDVRVKGGRGEEYAKCDGLWLLLPLEKM